jgi:hypothetical protein
MRRFKTKAVREPHEVHGKSRSTSQTVTGAKSSVSPSCEVCPSLGNTFRGTCSAEESAAQILRSDLSRVPQLLAIIKDGGTCAIESAALRSSLTQRFWECLQHGLASLGASILVSSHLWESSMVVACIEIAGVHSSEGARIVDIFLSCPDMPTHLIDSALMKLSPDCGLKLVRKRQVDIRMFPSIFQHAVFKELAWICSQFEFNQVFGTLLLSAITSYPEIPVLTFVKQRLPSIFNASKKLFLQNPSAHRLPSLPPPVSTPSESYSIPSHVNMRLVVDASGLLDCIEMVRANFTIGVDMEWSGTGNVAHSCGHTPADLIQIGNSPSASFCSVFLLDTMAVRREVNLLQILFCELFSPAHIVLVCDFSADRLALSAAFPEVTFPRMVAPQLLDLSLCDGKRKKSLSSLASDTCQINLSKSWQICGWNFRPWLQSQLEYATCDVLAMHLVYEQQQIRSRVQP